MSSPRTRRPYILERARSSARHGLRRRPLRHAGGDSLPGLSLDARHCHLLRESRGETASGRRAPATRPPRLHLPALPGTEDDRVRLRAAAPNLDRPFHIEYRPPPRPGSRLHQRLLCFVPRLAGAPPRSGLYSPPIPCSQRSSSIMVCLLAQAKDFPG